MWLDFAKMNGAGNDFILIDNRDLRVRLNPEQVARLCHRQRGIGADGLVLLIPSASGRADWAWDFYNSDGSVAEMCGNASRCFARFIQRLTGAQGRITFETGAGIITAVLSDGQVTVSLTSPCDLRLDQQITVAGVPRTVHSLNTGVPHAVLFVEDADRAMIQTWGSEIRHHPHFSPKGTNANFVEVLPGQGIRVRTYERGVEGETLACGTGVTASALISARVHRLKSPVRVRVQNGDWLQVDFQEAQGGFSDVRLTGPAEFVFEGRIEVV